jgi:hypothetical protein
LKWLTKKYPWFIFIAELIMTEIKPILPNTVPEPDAPKERPSGLAEDPGQTKLLPANAAFSKQLLENSPAIDSASISGVADEPKPTRTIMGWFKKLSQSAIIWISLSIILIFLAVIILLITQARQKSKILRPLTGEQIEAEGEVGSNGVGSVLRSKLARQADKPILLLTDDEFAGQAPTVVKATGPVISTDIDPELAAMVDALKIRLKISADCRSTSRGNTVTNVYKGDFRGFKIDVEERIENQSTFFEETTVITPKKGFIKTVNRVLDSIRESDLERFAVELRNAGLEIIRLPLQPGNKVFKVQFKAVSIFGKPIAGDFLISGKSVGKISLGMPTTQLETMLLSSYIVLKRKVLVKDTYNDVYKVLDQSNEPLFFVYENKGLVWGISIISDLFKTEKGIGINSNLGDIRINYPRVNVGISEKKIPFVKIDGVDGLFVIQNEGVDIGKHIFPSKTKVISILIGNSLEFE